MFEIMWFFLNDIEITIFVKYWLFKCDFCEKYDFENLIFHEKWASEMWFFKNLILNMLIFG